MIKAILFDFGQTLVDSADAFRAAEKDAKDKLFKALNAKGGGPEWDLFLPQYRSTRKEFHQQSNFSRPAIWQRVGRHFDQGLNPGLLENWEQSYWEQVSSRTKPFPETLPVLERLASQYRLGLITNTQGQKRAGRHRLALFPKLENFFQTIIVAGESGIPPKPDIKPFQLCLQQLDIHPQEAVFVGDDWRIDIRGALHAGIRPVWLQHYTVKRNWPEVQTDVPVITNLHEISDLPHLQQVQT